MSSWRAPAKPMSKKQKKEHKKKVDESVDKFKKTEIWGRTTPEVTIEPGTVIFVNFAHFIHSVENALQLQLKEYEMKANIGGIFNINIKWDTSSTYFVNGSNCGLFPSEPFDRKNLNNHPVLHSCFIKFIDFVEEWSKGK